MSSAKRQRVAPQGIVRLPHAAAGSSAAYGAVRHPNRRVDRRWQAGLQPTGNVAARGSIDRTGAAGEVIATEAEQELQFDTEGGKRQVEEVLRSHDAARSDPGEQIRSHIPLHDPQVRAVWHLYATNPVVKSVVNTLIAHITSGKFVVRKDGQQQKISPSVEARMREVLFPVAKEGLLQLLFMGIATVKMREDPHRPGAYKPFMPRPNTYTVYVILKANGEQEYVYYDRVPGGAAIITPGAISQTDYKAAENAFHGSDVKLVRDNQVLFEQMLNHRPTVTGRLDSIARSLLGEVSDINVTKTCMRVADKIRAAPPYVYEMTDTALKLNAGDR